jgi:hypothetical protein
MSFKNKVFYDEIQEAEMDQLWEAYMTGVDVAKKTNLTKQRISAISKAFLAKTWQGFDSFKENIEWENDWEKFFNGFMPWLELITNGHTDAIGDAQEVLSLFPPDIKRDIIEAGRKKIGRRIS